MMFSLYKNASSSTQSGIIEAKVRTNFKYRSKIKRKILPMYLKPFSFLFVMKLTPNYKQFHWFDYYVSIKFLGFIPIKNVMLDVKTKAVRKGIKTQKITASSPVMFNLTETERRRVLGYEGKLGDWKLPKKRKDLRDKYYIIVIHKITEGKNKYHEFCLVENIKKLDEICELKSIKSINQNLGIETKTTKYIHKKIDYKSKKRSEK